MPIYRTDTEYHAALRAAGHTLVTVGTPPRVDIFVLDAGHHNGPGCVTCRESWCPHCQDQIEPCARPAIDGEATNVTAQRALPAPGGDA